ncbi:regulatory protein RecX [Aestuariicella hydrocarbonica]|uniref:Regulatory protein RecX n=1 Tax=Pseudomaricurvus hydrocarbonicus TaxID=1470433 RepID=A0A9E5MQ50_9GAMM|nr:regulatory protein RecX [Aestuariicella hydrocarbonica]NHO68305.1 regulatory protein RecX [Aestuariicella hydrocarbonica]
MHETQAPDQAATYRQIRWSGMDLLARREHSGWELEQKLVQRYPDSLPLIERVIHDLQDELLQSDQRYTQAYVAMRRRKGYGPHRLMNELREKGVDSEMVVEELNQPEHEWAEQAGLVLRKKFKAPASDFKERSKQMRFLQYRGFSHEQIREVLQS